MKKRNERRRRTRKTKAEKQIGGGSVRSISEWVGAVKNTDIFKKQVAEYTISSLIDPNLQFEQKVASNELITNIPSEFDINSFNSQYPSEDIRDIGNSVAMIRNEWFKDIGRNTPADFKNYITNRSQDLNDPDAINFKIAVQYLITVEQMFRNEVNFMALTDESKYPLFVWALMVNSEANEVPSLVPEKQAIEESRRFSESASQVQPLPAVQVQPLPAVQVQPLPAVQVQPLPTVQAPPSPAARVS